MLRKGKVLGVDEYDIRHSSGAGFVCQKRAISGLT
jgi:hypothetical protein